MRNLIILFLFIVNLLMVSCGNDDEQDIYPIRFEQQEYTVRFGVGTNINFMDGGGVYELTASNPEVLGKFYIDNDVHSLFVFPKGVGESCLTITDVRANRSVTLKFTVENFYLSFDVDEIEGKNTNPYLKVGAAIIFNRDDNNTKQLEILWKDNLTHKWKCMGYGVFDIERSETNIFTLNMALHYNSSEELETFSYTLGGDGEYLNLFDKSFKFNWDKSIASKSQPVRRIQMILTDRFNGCKITCSLQPR